MRYFGGGRENRERDHIHITFITIYFYNGSILLLVTLVNLLSYPTDELNCLMVYRSGRNHKSVHGLIQPPLGVLKRVTTNNGLPVNNHLIF